MSTRAPALRSERAVTVRNFRSEDEPRVLQLLQSAFGTWPHGLHDVSAADFFAWKHSASPFGPSTMLVAELDEELVGFIALMPWRLRFGAQVHEAMRGVDLAVDPAVHRRGVSMSLIGHARSQYSDEVVLGWSNPNEQSRGGSIKSGRQEVSALQRFVGLGGARWATLRRLASPAGPTPLQATPPGESASTLLVDHPAVPRLLASPPPRRGAIVTALDREFLRWRYGWPETYRALALDDAAGAAIAIYRIQRHGRFTVTHICELVVERDDAGLARRLVQGVRRAGATDFLVVALGSRGLAARCGLVRSRRAAPLTIKPLREHLVPDPTKPASWALSLGDLEMI